MNVALLQFCENLLTALGNGLGQGLLVGLVVWIALKCMRRANAATRYAVRFASLVVVAVLPLLNFAWSPPIASESVDAPAGEVTAGDRDTAVTNPSGEVAALVVRESALPVGPDAAEAADAFALEPWQVAEFGGNPSSVDGGAPGVEPVAGSAIDVASGGARGDADQGRESDATASAVEGSEAIGVGWVAESWDRFRSWRDRSVARPVTLSTWLVVGLALAWITLAAGRLGLLALQVLTLRRFKREAVEAPAAMIATFGEVRRKLNVARSVGLGLCPELGSPIAAGFVRPMILLPVEFAGAGPADWERIMRHELAHLSRGDDWTNLVQQTIRSVLFFHPVVLWLSRRMTVDREIACDDHVLSASGRAREYALFLTDFARRNNGREWSAAPAAWSNPSQLKERIHMLLDTKRNASPHLARGGAGAWITGVLLVAALGLYATPRFAFAGSAGNVNLNANADDEAGTPPVPPAPPVAPAAPSVEAVPVPRPMPAPRPSRSSGKDESLESRLDRLEKMVESLATKDKGKALYAPEPFKVKKGDEKPMVWTAEGLDLAKLRGEIAAKVKEGWAHTPSFESMSRILADVARQVEQATREAERAVQEALKSAKLSAEAKEPREAAPPREDIEARRHALGAERRALQKQIARVEAQLGKLDGQLDRVDGILDGQMEAAESERERAHEQARAVADHEKAAAKARAKADKIRHEQEKIARDAVESAHSADHDSPPPTDKAKEKVKTKDKSGDATPGAENPPKK